jgi:hypothetical protein
MTTTASQTQTRRTLANCPAVIFIAYTVGADAEPRGYSDWLRRIDNPFFNAIPGVRCYANWRVDTVLSGGPLAWDYFDFQGLAAEDDLERVWFNADLDGFRREWIRLWGYGRPTPLPVHAHAYLMRPTAPLPEPATGHLRLVAGTGAPPAGVPVLRVDGVLSKHFAAGAGEGAGRGAWCRPVGGDNPLGLDWMALCYGDDATGLAGAPPPAEGDTVDLLASLIAEPDPEAAAS